MVVQVVGGSLAFFASLIDPRALKEYRCAVGAPRRETAWESFGALCEGYHSFLD